jgi:hypothetical protein
MCRPDDAVVRHPRQARKSRAGTIQIGGYLIVTPLDCAPGRVFCFDVMTTRRTTFVHSTGAYTRHSARTVDASNVSFDLKLPFTTTAANGRDGEGFRMPAHADLSGRTPGRRPKAPPGRNPRGAVWAVAVYGDLTGRRLG